MKSMEESTVKAKRTEKAGTKKSRRVAKATLQAASQPFNPEVIKQAVAEYERKDPTQPRRGRKPVREDIYIEESLKKINEMEGRMRDERDTLTSKEREELRNKASALRSRVNRKLEHRTFMRDLDIAKEQFEALGKFIVEEFDNQARERISTKIMAAGMPQPAGGTKIDAKSIKMTKKKSSNTELINLMKQFIGFE